MIRFAKATREKLLEWPMHGPTWYTQTDESSQEDPTHAKQREESNHI